MGTHSWLIAPKRVIWAGLCLAVLFTLILVACGGSTAANSGSTPAPAKAAQVVPTPTSVPAVTSANVVIVRMLESPPGHYFFKPDTLTIKAGTVVVWMNGSDAPHTVTSDPNATSPFDTAGNITEGKLFSLVFNTPGTYNYHCNIHPGMKAVITVTP